MMGTGPVALQCGACGETIYSATAETCNLDDVRKAVIQHKTRCKNPVPKPQEEEAYEA